MTNDLQPGSAAFGWRITSMVAVYAASLVLVGGLRYCEIHCDEPPALSRFTTLIYIGITVVTAVVLMRSGVPLQRLGFGVPVRPLRYLALIAVAVGVIKLAGWLLEPALEDLFGSGRDLSRFSDVAGSPEALVKLLVLNWTVAAFGEELAFRIVLMLGIAFVLGNDRKAFAIALIAQAIIFGLVHAYQGPAGIVGTTLNGLVYGAVTLAARGSIWPAAIAHGLSNTIGILGVYSLAPA